MDLFEMKQKLEALTDEREWLSESGYSTISLDNQIRNLQSEIFEIEDGIRDQPIGYYY